MHALLVLPLALMGAFAFRTRGGLWEDQHVRGQLARLAWGVSCAVTVLVAAGPRAWWIALAVGLLTWVSTMAGLHDTIDMGRNDGTFGRDFAVGTLHGLVLGAAAAVPLAFARYGTSYVPELGAWGFPLWWLPLVGGAAWSACYALCWLRRDWPEIRAARLGKYGNPCEAAELAVGLEFTAVLFFAASS